MGEREGTLLWYLADVLLCYWASFCVFWRALLRLRLEERRADMDS